jgi:hypothetical protein
LDQIAAIYAYLSGGNRRRSEEKRILGRVFDPDGKPPSVPRLRKLGGLTQGRIAGDPG